LDKLSGSLHAVVLVRRSVFVSLFALTSLVVSSRPAAAAEGAAATNADSDADDLNLENLLRLKVITASGGVAEESDLAPANVFTILSSEIANNGWRSVTEVLEHVPGMYVVDDYVTQNVEVRGASSGLRAGTRIMKVMINGTDVSFRPDLNALIGPEFIPIEVVERIEIARGPLSALYGANAFLATVNVVTIDPDHIGGAVNVAGAARPYSSGTGVTSNPTTGAGGISTPVSGGTALSGGAAGVAMARLGQDVKLLLSASYDQINRRGLTIPQTFGTGSSTPHVGITSGSDLARPLGVFGRLSGPTGVFGDFSLQGGLQQSDSNGNFQLGSVMTGATRESIRNLWAEAQHNGRWTNMISSTVAVGYAHGAPTSNDRMFVTDQLGSYFSRSFAYDALDAKASITVTPRTNLRLSAGVDTTYETDKTLIYTQHYLVADMAGAHQPGDTVEQAPADPRRSVTVTKVAPNVHASFDPLSGVRLSADGRVDFLNQFDKQISYRGAAGWRILPKLVVKFIGGRAFQTPSTVFTYAYAGFGTADITGSKNVPFQTAQLTPQTVTSGELVLNFLPSEHLSINASGYYQSIANQISFNTIGTGYYATNLGNRSSFGGELNVTGRFWRLEPYGRFSMQKFGTDPNRRATDRGPQIPPALVPAVWGLIGLRATVPQPHLTFDATWRGVGERGASAPNIFLNSGQSYALPAYQQFDLAATATFIPLGKGHDTRVQFAVRNVLDQRHNEPGFGGIDIPSLGRTFQLGLTQMY
jgi:outer membrane receptor protein involved in Fe transport